MNICLPTAGNSGIEEKVYDHFGSAAFIAVYNAETENLSFIENGNKDHQHGQCNPLAMISDQDIRAIIVGGMGRRAISRLNDSGIRVYIGDNCTIKEAIRRLQDGNLTELSLESACNHGGGCH